jgi:hypothetical protein
MTAPEERNITRNITRNGISSRGAAQKNEQEWIHQAYMTAVEIPIYLNFDMHCGTYRRAK